MLSKSKYCAFVQCPKNLWLGINKPEVATVDSSVESRMDSGNEIGDLAMRLFGDFVEVTAYKDNGRLDLSKMISHTADLMSNGQPVICEASFSYNGNYCAVDILKRENDGYAIYEVKSSTGASQIYAVDIAYQKYILEHAGVKVVGTYLVCINSDYVFDGELKLDEFFKIIDMSAAVDEESQYVANNILLANNVIKEAIEPALDISENCREPYPCPFWEHCTAHLPKPSVFDLYKLGFKKELEYYRKGIVSFEALEYEAIMKNHIRSLQVSHQLLFPSLQNYFSSN